MAEESKTVEAVRVQLRAYKGHLRAVAHESGVPYSTVAKIAQGKTKNPGTFTIERLMGYLFSARGLASLKADRGPAP